MSVTDVIVNRFSRSRLAAGIYQALDEARAALESLPGDARSATTAGDHRIAAQLGDLEPKFRRHIRTVRRWLRMLYADGRKRRSELARVRRFRLAEIECVLALLRRNGGALPYREIRRWFDRLGWQRPAGARFYGMLCVMEQAGCVTGRYVVSDDGRDRAFALPRPPAGGRRS